MEKILQEIHPINNGKLVAGDASDLVSEVLNVIYPVGALYISCRSSLPTALSNIGTWTQIDNGLSIWTTKNSSLGSILNGLLPEHTHSFSVYSADAGTPNAIDYGKQVTYQGTVTTDTGKIDSEQITNVSMGTTLRPPSIGVRIWKRTA